MLMSWPVVCCMALKYETIEVAYSRKLPAFKIVCCGRILKVCWKDTRLFQEKVEQNLQ